MLANDKLHVAKIELLTMTDLDQFWFDPWQGQIELLTTTTTKQDLLDDDLDPLDQVETCLDHRLTKLPTRQRSNIHSAYTLFWNRDIEEDVSSIYFDLEILQEKLIEEQKMSEKCLVWHQFRRTRFHLRQGR